MPMMSTHSLDAAWLNSSVDYFSTYDNIDACWMVRTSDTCKKELVWPGRSAGNASGDRRQTLVSRFRSNPRTGCGQAVRRHERQCGWRHARGDGGLSSPGARTLGQGDPRDWGQSRIEPEDVKSRRAVECWDQYRV